MHTAIHMQLTNIEREQKQ